MLGVFERNVTKVMQGVMTGFPVGSRKTVTEC